MYHILIDFIDVLVNRMCHRELKAIYVHFFLFFYVKRIPCTFPKEIDKVFTAYVAFFFFVL